MIRSYCRGLAACAADPVRGSNRRAQLFIDFVMKYLLICVVWGLILGSPGHHLGRISEVWEVPGTPWATKDHPRGIQTDFVLIFWVPWGPHFGDIFRVLGPFGDSWPPLGLSWRLLGLSWSPLGQC